MKEIFDFNQHVVVAINKDLRLIIFWDKKFLFTINIIDLKNKINELDASESDATLSFEEAIEYAENWMAEISRDIIFFQEIISV